jgi:hypothetical protein
MSYRHRRLRPPRPVVVLRYIGTGRIDTQTALLIRRQWLRAERAGFAIVNGEQWDVAEVKR